MALPATRQVFDGTFNRMDFLFAETLLSLQNPAALDDIENTVMALGPGKLYVLPAFFSGAYGVVIYELLGNCNIVSILGTQSPFQLIAELAFSNLIAYDGIPGHVSAYFAFDLAVITVAIKSAINPALPTVFLGHSLGGASAELLASQWQNVYGYPVRSVYTLGAPKPGGADFASSLSCPVVRLENYGDIVPSVPDTGLIDGLTPFGIFPVSSWADYVHPGNGYTLNADGTIDPFHIEMSATEIVATILTGNTDIHYLSTYDARLRMGMPQPGDLVCGGNGYEKPWKLFGLEEQPPAALQTGNVNLQATPIRRDAYIPVGILDREGTLTPSGEVFDAAPVSYAPLLQNAPSAATGCCS